MLDNNPEEPRETIELKASKEVQPPTTGETLQDRLQAAMGAAAVQTPRRDRLREALAEQMFGAGAAAAAGVLTAVDEDEENGEEAPVPDEFGYETDEADVE